MPVSLCVALDEVGPNPAGWLHSPSLPTETYTRNTVECKARACGISYPFSQFTRVAYGFAFREAACGRRFLLNSISLKRL
jgi:hypothetical protein